MRIGRTLPPAAAPIGIRDLVSGIRGVFHGEIEIDRFRSELTEYFGMKHCFLVSAGKAALTLILRALRELYPDRDEVLTQAFTCYSVPSSIVRAGLKVRLCDMQVDGLDFDFAQLSAILAGRDRSDVADGPSVTAVNAGGVSRRILAAISTHLYGVPADVPRLRSLIGDPGVTIIEDAAQAMGESCGGQRLGTLGDVSFFSLGRGKAFSTVEGGIILTNRDDIAAKLRHAVSDLPRYSSWEVLALFFKAVALSLFLHPLLFWIPRCLPFLRLGETLFQRQFPVLKMSSFQAGLARNWRSKLPILQGGRKKNVNRWLAVLEKLAIHGWPIHDARGLGLVRFPMIVNDVYTKESLLRESTRRGLGIMPVYPDSIDGISELQGHIGALGCPAAKRCANGLVTLPTHDYLTEKDVSEIGRLLALALACDHESSS